MLKYYVYMSFYRGILVYVGKGKGNRINHTFLGDSGNKVINEFYFRNKFFNDFPLETRKVSYFKMEDAAFRYEKDMIDIHQPLCNNSTSLWVEKNLSVGLTKKLQRITGDLTISSSIIKTRYNEDLLLTPFGLPCSLSCQHVPNFLEKTLNGNYKLSSYLLKFFPTKGSKFLTSSIKIDHDSLVETNFSKLFLSLEDNNNVYHPEISPDWLLENKGLLIYPNQLIPKDELSFVKEELEEVTAVTKEPDTVIQVKWTETVRNILLNNGFVGDLNGGYGYVQLSKQNGYCFSVMKNIYAKTISTKVLTKFDLSEFTKSRYNKS